VNLKTVVLLPCLLSAQFSQGFFDCSVSEKSYPLAIQPLSEEVIRIFPSRSESRPISVSLVVHGLNTKPEIMDPLIFLLQGEGSEVFRVGLKGHRRDADQMEKVSADLWADELHLAYEKARKRADALGVPLYFLGYSLGALVHAQLMGAHPEMRIDRQVLFAPALRVKWSSKALLSLKWLGSSFCIPSMNLATHRANDGTRLAAYQALFDLGELFEKTPYQNFDLPTLLVIDPADELVNFSRIQKDLEERNLTNWKVLSLVGREARLLPAGVYHHSITDRIVLGDDDWSSLVFAIRAHLK
jgi:hypothetical protein